MFKKILFSGVVVLSFFIYAVSLRLKDSNKDQVTLANLQNSQSPTTTVAPVAALPAMPHPNMNTMMPTDMYRNGSYLGKVADAFYGPMQVQAIIQNGKLADIQFLQYPNDRETSLEISRMSLPRLKTEVIQAQNAHVDIVSGATQTSEAFRETVESALTKARL